MKRETIPEYCAAMGSVMADYVYARTMSIPDLAASMAYFDEMREAAVVATVEEIRAGGEGNLDVLRDATAMTLEAFQTRVELLIKARRGKANIVPVVFGTA